MIKENNSYNYIQKFIENLQADGRNSFSLKEVELHFDKSKKALKIGLNRLVKKDKIYSVRKGFYVIIPPEYSFQAVLPPVLFIDQLMKYLQKEYYIGLRSAALLHGAAHQQPQVFDVFVKTPALRSVETKGMKIIFYTRKNIPQNFLEPKKTDSGFVLVSNPVLTALDLVKFQKGIGGIVRATEIIIELSEQFKINMIKNILKTNKAISTSWQRLGFILEKVGKGKLSDVIYRSAQDNLKKIPLSTLHKATGFSSENRWKIVENINLDIL